MTKKTMFRICLVLLLILLGFGAIKFFSLVDLRAKNELYPNDQLKAQQLMEDMGIAHGIHMWDSIESYTAVYGEEFYGFLGTQSHPFSEQKMQFSLNYIPKTYNGQLEFLTGEEKGNIWGIQSGQMYMKKKNGEVESIPNKDMKFWIPTYQYFIEFPSRIQETTALEYLGTKVINGVETEGVLASWNTVEPQRDIDQYIIWIDKNSKRIVKVDYTVREMYGFVSGAAYFNNYIDYNGLILPSELPVESNLVRKGFLHKMSILNFKADIVDRASLLPLDVDSSVKLK